MKRSIIILTILLYSLVAFGQTNPVAQSLPYSQDFNSFTGSTTTYPAGLQGWGIPGSTSTNYPVSAPNANQVMDPGGATNADMSAFVGDMNGKIGVMSTGSSLKTLCLTINTSGYTGIAVSYLAATQRQQNANRIGAIGIQYRIGTSGSFIDIAGTDYQNPGGSDNISGTNSINPTSISLMLPSACDNQPVVQLRWVYKEISGSGNRPSFSIDNISVSPVPPTCTTPTASASGLNFGIITSSSIEGNFSAASPVADEYLIVASTSNSLTSNPVNGQAYDPADNIGDGFVINMSNSLTFTANGLTASTNYYFFIFSVNSNCTGGPFYLTSSLLQGQATTAAGFPPCSPPSTQPTALVFGTAGTFTIPGSFTATTANEYLVVTSTSASLSNIPVNGQTYIPGDLIGNGTVVQADTATTFTASSLVDGTTYYFFIFSNNDQSCTGGPAYNTTTPLTGSATTMPLSTCTTPAAQPGNLNLSASNNSISGSFTTAAGADDYLVIRSNNSSLSASPVNNTNYNVGDNLGGGTVISNSGSTSFITNNLTPGTTYYFYIFAAHRFCSGGTKYLTTSPLTGNIATTNTTVYNYYFGTLHSHSDYSDGNQDNPGYTPTDDYAYAQTAECMDFLGISEHNHFSSVNNPGTLLSLYHQGVTQADTYTSQHPGFVALYGMEWGVISGGGHVLIYGDGMNQLWGWESGNGTWGATNNYDLYVPKNVYTGSTGLFNAVNNNSASNTFALLAHPQNGDFNNIAGIAYNIGADNAIVGTAVESGPAASTNTTYSDPGTSMAYMSTYKTLLAKGYHLGPTIDHDNHNTTFGHTAKTRTAVIAPALTKTSLIQAIRNMHFYATQDCDAKVAFTINNQIMGSVMTNPGTPAISVIISDATTNYAGATINLMSGVPGSGSLPVRKTFVTGSSLTFIDNALTNLSTRYYYVEIINGSVKIVTSPIWYTRNDSSPGCTGAIGGTASGSTSFCGSGSTTITANGYSNGAGSGYQWQYSSDNFIVDIHDSPGAINPATLSTGTISSTTSYRLKVTCTSGTSTAYSNTITVTINNSPAVNAPAVTQPTCATPTGTIVVNATGSGTLEYSLNGGAYQLSNTFSGLAAGNYNIAVRLQSSPTCITNYSSNPVTINAIPATPVVNAPTVTQPTCATPTGTIEVNATGSGTLEYSLNGGAYQVSNSFSGLAPGNYNIAVRLQSSPTCITNYSGNPVVINAVPAAPVVNAPTITQPTCATPTGTIVVNATGSGTLEYSLNGGAYQVSNTFSGLAAGNYNIAVRLQSSPTCITNYSGNPAVINTEPVVPDVNPVSNQALNNGASTTAITFSGSVPGTVYNWTNNTPSIGLAASGSGNIASFMVTNTSNATVTATITVTPSYTNAGGTCTGTPQNFTITVYPPPVYIHGSVRKNADPTKIDVVFKPTYTSVSGEYVNYFQFSVAIPAAGNAGVTATAVAVNAFQDMGTLILDGPYTEGSEIVFNFGYLNPTAPPINNYSWTSGVEFTGVEVTFSTANAASVGKMVDFTNNEGGFGGINGNTLYGIVSNTGDKTDYISGFFYAIPGESVLGNYPSNGDQFVQTISSIHGSVKKNADPTKIDVVFKPTYTSVSGEYINYFQFSVAIPAAGNAGVTATAVAVNAFQDMGTLILDGPYTEGSEIVFNFGYLNPAAPPVNNYSWTSGAEFTGVEVTFSTTNAALVGKMVDFTNNEGGFGGVNGNTLYGIVSNTGDKTDYVSGFFYAIPGESALGTYPSNGDQYVQTIATAPLNDNAPGAFVVAVGGGCTGAPYTNAGATQSSSEPFAACQGTAGFKTVWYKFTAPASGAVRISSDYSGGSMGADSRLALYAATDVNNYATFTSLACDDDNGVTVSSRSILYYTGLTGGTTYYIQIDGKDGSTAMGTFCLTVDTMTSAMVATSTACAAGQDLTSVNNNYTGWLSATDATGKLVALIRNPAGTGTSTYSNSININAAVVRTDAVSNQKYLDRNYTINNAAVTNVDVRFFFLNTELTALQAADPGVTLANLQATRQTGTVCDNDFIAANGTNSAIAQSGNGTTSGFSWIQVNTPAFSKFALHTRKGYTPVKVWLQGAYSTAQSRHKNNTAAWVAVLNANALTQPYNVPGFGNYAGTESVSAGFFVATAATTDVTDWVLLELRDATTPATVISRRAAFIREDGKIVDLDGVSNVSFRTIPDGNYFYVIRHRNHLLVRSSVVRPLTGTMGASVPASYDFSTAQAQAFQNVANTVNPAMVDVGGGVFGMMGGNANAFVGTPTVGHATIRASGGSNPLINDYIYLITTVLGGNVTATIPNAYHTADLNMDGTVRANGGTNPAVNDYLFLITTALGGNVNKVLTQHQ